MARSNDNPSGSVCVSQQEYNHLKKQVDDALARVIACREELTQVSQDGTDDENPAFAQVRDKYAAINRDYTLLNEKLMAAVIITPEETDTNYINEATTKFTLRCTYSDTDVQVREYSVGHEFGCITPSSPLFTFLKGKCIGEKGVFKFKNIRDNTIVSYGVEVLDIQF